MENQDFWRGNPLRAIGFQRDLARHEVDVWWDEVVGDPQKAVGLYLVSTDAKGGMGVHDTAICEVAVLKVHRPLTPKELNAEVHRLHRVVLALRGMLVATGVATELLNQAVGPLNCSSCHAAPIEADPT